VLHWSEAAFDPAGRVAGGAVAAYPDRTDLTGRHTFEGFCIASGDLPEGPPGPMIRGTELGKLILGG
jgi:hypothetical protein